ncbi:hypothetical protein AB0J83_15865 [Actinoplanes sp. NPDC049596]|uniref:hypothetical protein n=1 Tax=unclassified Actinoplanes TaxID=2626549 RepID=UPI0034258015
MTETCELAEFLRATGPVRMPTRSCCVAALVGRGAQEAGLCEAQAGDVGELEEAAALLTPVGRS